MSKHTPGPWITTGKYSSRWEDANDDEETVRRVIEVKKALEPRPPDAMIVCEVNEQGGVEIANAHLIAAAPELLEALVNMTALAHAYVGDDPKGLALVAKATAAIFKAEGRQ